MTGRIITGEGFYQPSEVPPFNVLQAEVGTAWYNTLHGIELSRGSLTPTIGCGSDVLFPGDFDKNLKEAAAWALLNGSYEPEGSSWFSRNEKCIDQLAGLRDLAKNDEQQTEIKNALQMLRETSRGAEEERLDSKLAEIGRLITATTCLWLLVEEERSDNIDTAKIIARVAPIVGMTAIVQRDEGVYGSHLTASISPVLKGSDGKLGCIQGKPLPLNAYTLLPKTRKR